MEERRMQLYVGLMFLGTLIITIFVLWIFGKLPTWTTTYPVQVRFDYAPGVSTGTPVRKSGVRIGSVESVRLAEDDASVLVTVRIQSDKKIYRDEECCLTRDLLGDTALSFIPSEHKPAVRELVTPNTVLDGQISEDPTGLKRALSGPIGTVQNTGLALSAASDELRRAARNVNHILDAEKDRIHEVLENSAVAMGGLSKVLGDKDNQRRLADAMKRLPDTLDNMNATFRAAKDSLETFSKPGRDNKSTVQHMADTIEMIERTLRKFSVESEDGRPAPSDQIAAAMQDIGVIAMKLRELVSRIDEGNGTVGKLLNDPELYDRLVRAVRNVEQISRDLQPIVDNARLFSDKIARHPGVIVRDAVKPGVGIK